MGLSTSIADMIIRRKAMFHRVPVDRYEIRMARTVEDYEQAFRLVHVAYVYEGIESIKPIDLRITEQHVLPEASVLLAWEGGRCVGTVSITVDSPAGLALDKDFPEELSALRNSGARVVEIGSFAVVSPARRTGASQLLALACFRLGEKALGATHYVIGVHPKAAPFYKALWGFKSLGSCRSHAELAAPVVGLVLEREDGLRSMRRLRKPMQDGLRVIDYVQGEEAPKIFSLPEHLSQNAWTRWKMSREVFQELFVRRSRRLGQLSQRTRRHLRRRRSDQTVGRLIQLGAQNNRREEPLAGAS